MREKSMDSKKDDTLTNIIRNFFSQIKIVYLI